MKKSKNSLFIKAVTLFMVSLVLLMYNMDDVFATTVQNGKFLGAGLSGQVLCGAVVQLTAKLGKALAMIGILILGVGALYGKVTWGQATVVGVGIAVIFGASQIVVSIANTVPTNSGSFLINITPTLNCVNPR